MASHGSVAGDDGSVVLSADRSRQAKRLPVPDNVTGIGEKLGRPHGRGRAPPSEVHAH